MYSASMSGELFGGTFTYSRRSPAKTGYTFSIWVSIDLHNWIEDTGAVQPPDAAVNDVEHVTVVVSAPFVTGPTRYFRVRASNWPVRFSSKILTQIHWIFAHIYAPQTFPIWSEIA